MLIENVKDTNILLPKWTLHLRICPDIKKNIYMWFFIYHNTSKLSELNYKIIIIIKIKNNLKDNFSKKNGSIKKILTYQLRILFVKF